MDCIKIYGLELFAHHGVYDFETRQGQRFVVNATLYAELQAAGLSDRLELSTDYGAVCHFLTEYLQQNTFKLIEAAAEHAARALLLRFPLVRRLVLELCKPEAPVGLPFSNASVTLERGWTQVGIAFGSNLGDCDAQIARGLRALERVEGLRLLRRSDTITTRPYGGVAQPAFRNGVVLGETLLSPGELLTLLQAVEAQEGRDRSREQRWGPRTLDLDLLFYGALTMESERLTLPHPDMQNRDFVLRPLVQVAPQWRHPVLGLCAVELLARLEGEQC